VLVSSMRISDNLYRRRGDLNRHVGCNKLGFDYVHGVLGIRIEIKKRVS
jgi:hypothetical protein